MFYNIIKTKHNVSPDIRPHLEHLEAAEVGAKPLLCLYEPILVCVVRRVAGPVYDVVRPSSLESLGSEELPVRLVLINISVSINVANKCRYPYYIR